MSEDINETPAASPNFKTELAKQLEELVPEAIADGKVDVTKLKELLDGDAAGESERFGLFWPGKLNAIRAAQTPTTATLKPAPELSKDWDTTGNVFIEGDNLEALKILQKHYHGKIKMIYIDPPYNTGKDFVYPDNFKEGLQTYLEWTKQVNEEGQKLSSNSESDGRYHSHWLNMMYPRLKLARSLLSDDGAIFISIDDHELPRLQQLCDEIFGSVSYTNTACWYYQNSTMKNPSNRLASTHEYILIYSRNPSRLSWNSIRNGEVSANLIKRFGKITNSNLEITYGAALDAGEESYLSRMVPKFVREHGRQPDREDVIGKLEPNYLRDVIELPTIRSNDFASSFGFEFSNPKNPRLLELLIRLLTESDRGGIILDFFSGSGTTAHAVMQLNAEDGGNRRHIQVQLPEPVDPSSEAGKAGFKTIADIARKRIDLAGEKIKQDYAEQLAKRETPLDVGYRTYKLTDTNFSKWRETSATDPSTLEQHLLDLRENANDDSDQLALLTEILLKQGYSLTEKVEQVQVDGLDVLSVAGGLALAYVNEQVKPTLEQFRALVNREPERLIILEDAFQGDDQLKTNLVQLAKTKHVNLWTA